MPSTDPILFVKETYPALFNKGVAELEARATSEPQVAERLKDIRAARSAARLVFDGEGEVFLVTENGKMTASDTKPENIPVLFSASADAEAARVGLAALFEENVLDHPRAAMSVAKVASSKVDSMLSKEKLSFHVTLKDVPDVDQVTIKIALGLADPAAAPNFSATVSYEDIEDVRAGKLKPQALFMTKTKLVGDASRAMTLAMQIMQARR